MSRMLLNAFINIGYLVLTFSNIFLLNQNEDILLFNNGQPTSL